MVVDFIHAADIAMRQAAKAVQPVRFR